MVYQLFPKRLRILWASKYCKNQYYISVTHTLDERSNISGYARMVDIEVYFFNFSNNENEFRKFYNV